jgi:hypothetical protein
MNYMADFADKVVESVEPYQAYDGALADKVSVIHFTDGTELSVHIDSRTFYYGGAEVRTDDLDVITTDRFFLGGVSRTPQPPNFRMPGDPILREIFTAFKGLKVKLMSYYGAHHANPETEFEAVVKPWRETVQRYSGYRRGNNIEIAVKSGDRPSLFRRLAVALG